MKVFAWLDGNMTSSTGSSDWAGTITVGFTGTEGGSVVLTSWAQSSSSNEMVCVGTCPLGVESGESTNTFEDRGDLAAISS